MEWLRWFHGTASDPKWPLIARKAGVSIGVVVSVWAALLEHASQDEARGCVANFDALTFDVLYGYEDGTCAAVVSALEERGVISGGCIAAWDRRQVQDENAAERKRLQREREKLEKERQALEKLRHEMSQEKEIVAECVTHSHRQSHPVTESHLEQRRTEKNRAEKKEESIANAMLVPEASGTSAAEGEAPLLTGEENPKPKEPPQCPHSLVLEAYHEILPELPRMKAWGDDRQAQLRARWREKWQEGKFADGQSGIDYFRRLFAYIRESEFLMGRADTRSRDRPFMASLDWICKRSNFQKIIEGRYHQRDPS